MASELKRKRGPVDVLAVDSPKRSKSVKAESQKQANRLEAVLNPPPNTQELTHTNGDSTEVNGEKKNHKVVDSMDSEDKKKRKKENKKKQREQKRLESAQIAENTKEDSPIIWKLSEAIAGRMIDADPVFTKNEKFLILANRTTINIYSTGDSLLTRSVKLLVSAENRTSARIVAYSLSPGRENILWVACSDGSIYRIDWRTGEGAGQSWSVSSTGCIHMTAASMESAERKRDVVFTTEATKDGRWRITANELALPGSKIETTARTIYSSKERIGFLKTARDGSVIVGYAGSSIIVGYQRKEFEGIEKMRYVFHVFESSEVISSLDVRVTERKLEIDTVTKGKGESGINHKAKAKSDPIVDVVVGDVKGAIYLHNNLLQNLAMLKSMPSISLLPRKLHWHRQEVHTVKFSLDGAYIISGGTETVLVLWQLDTGKQQFLPHMSSTIQNVVVSPTGRSYAIQLAENSALVLSTAELKPTVNVAGIQSCVLGYGVTPGVYVKRAQEDSREFPLFQRTPAAINPLNASQLLLGVGQVQQVGYENVPIISTPYLQSFDLKTGYNVSRQALTRSNITNVNITPASHRVSEPHVTHLKLSFDGKWMASIDEWMPTKQDLAFTGYEGDDIEAERWSRREIFLKFWQRNAKTEKWELVSRINAPHTIGEAGSAGKVLDLAADPSSLRFATIGEDKIARTWAPKSRKRDGLVLSAEDGTSFKSWHCMHAMPLAKIQPYDADSPLKPLANGSVCFSEDGSIIAAAFGNENGIVYFLSPETGVLTLTHNNMYKGEIVKMEFLGQDLVTLSDRVKVYDLVLDEMRYSFDLGPVVTSLATEQKVEMMHLAIDRQSRTFAVALPGVANKSPLYFPSSDLAVFHQDKHVPLLKEALSTLVTALIPAVGSEGFLALDSAAEIRTIFKKGSQVVTTLAQSTSAMGVKNVDGIVAQADDDDDDDIMDVDTDMEGLPNEYKQEFDDYETPVVTQQQLNAVFDIGPSFALPLMEDLFYQVVDLFSASTLEPRD